MKKLKLIPMLVIFIFLGCKQHKQKQYQGLVQIGKEKQAKEEQEIKGLNFDHMRPVYIYAKSSIKDKETPGGFGGSDNLPKKYRDDLNFSEGGMFLKIVTSGNKNTSECCRYTLFIVNKSDSILELRAIDSRLPVIAEVFHEEKWQPIEYLPRPICGRSFHNVSLNVNEYWDFGIPKYEGNIKTKLRYSLRSKDGWYLYSNEINVSFNMGQLKKKYPNM